MSQNYDNPFIPQQQYDPFQNQQQLRVSLTWSEVWSMVLSNPSVVTFQTILSDVNANLNRGLIWVLIAGFISGVASFITQLIFGGSAFNFGQTSTTSSSLGAGFSFIFIFITPIIAVIGFVIGAGIIHISAKILGGQGDWDPLAYAMSAVYAPLSIIGGVASIIPCLGALVALGAGLYQIVLYVIAIKTVHQFGWFQAILSVLLIPLLLIGLAVCCIVALAGGAASS